MKKFLYGFSLTFLMLAIIFLANHWKEIEPLPKVILFWGALISFVIVYIIDKIKMS